MIAPQSPALSDLRILWRLLKPQWPLLLLVLLCLALAAASEPMLVAVVKYTVDWKDGGMPSWVRYPMLPGMMLLVFALRGAAVVATNHVLGGICADIVRKIQCQNYRQMLGYPALASRDVSVSKLIHLLTFEIRQCSDFVERVIGKLIKALLTTLALYVSLFMLHWRFSLLLTLALPLIVGTCWVFASAVRRLTSWQILLNERLSMLTSVRSRQVAMVKIHGTAEQEMKLFGASAEEYRRCQLKLFTATSIPGPMTQCVVALLVGIVMMWCSQAIQSGEMTVGSASAYVTSILLILNPLRNLADLTGPILRSFIGMQNVFSLNGYAGTARTDHLHKGKLRGNITFSNVYARYDSQTEWALAGCDFTVCEGEIVALIGPVGAGKSSVFEVLRGNIVISDGLVNIDGIPFRQWSPPALNKQIAIVSQIPELFKRSILLNVAYADTSPDIPRVWEMLGIVGLSDWVESLPMALDTALGPGQMEISEGQSRLLALARALYTKAPLLLLDEPTASLDDKAADHVHQALRHLRREGRSALVITHSAATQACADRTISMFNGAVLLNEAIPVRKHTF